MKNNKLLRLIISVVISIGLWVYVVNVVNPSSTTVIRNIPVTLVGTQDLKEKNLAIVGSGEYTVDLTVRASRTDLMVISEDNFFATADVSGLTMGQDYITVEIDSPNGYVVEDIKSRKIQVYVDELESITVPVEIVYSAVAEGYETTVLDVYPQSVEIYGAKQLVEKVGKYEVSINSNDLIFEEVATLELSGKVKDLSGNVLAGVFSSSESVTAWATVYSTKKVNFKPLYGGAVWEGAVVSAIKAPTSITIKGPSDSLAEISEVSSEWISIDGICEDFEEDLIPILPEDVYPADADKDIKFTVDIADNGVVSFIYYVGEIVVNNLPSGLSVNCSLKEGAYVTAEVTGPVAVLKTMSDSDVTLSIDASGFKQSTKEAKLAAGTQITGVSINLSPSTVNVEVGKY